MRLLILVTLVLAGLCGAGVVFASTPQRQVFAMGANGLVLSLLFMALQAPDVAFAELIIGAAALPLILREQRGRARVASTKMNRGSRDPKP